MGTRLYRTYEPDECGPDGYPFAWHETIKHQVRAEAGHRCVRCGHPFVVAADIVQMHEPLAVEAAWRILTVHHLNGRKHDCRWWNLVALCQRCHLYTQRKVQLEQVYPWEHSDWFKPYAAGWYAYAYRGQEVTRRDAEAMLEELLDLERAEPPEACAIHGKRA